VMLLESGSGRCRPRP